MVSWPGICLDTDVCVDLLRGRTSLERLSSRLLPGAVTWISSISLSELEYSIPRASAPATARVRVSWLLEFVGVRSFDARAAAAAGLLRYRLSRSGQGIGPWNTLIGAHALAEEATLVTRNVREFGRIDGLTIVDFQSAV